MKKTSQRKKKPEHQKSHPDHIKSCQHISRKICPVQKRQHRICFRQNPVFSKYSRKQNLHTKDNSTHGKKGQDHRLSGTSLFFYFFKPKRQKPHSGKNTEKCIHIPDHPFPGKPATGTLHGFQKIFRFSLSCTQNHKKENPCQKNSTGNFCNPSSSLHSPVRSQTACCHSKQRQPFPGNPADQTLWNYFCKKIRQKSRT